MNEEKLMDELRQEGFSNIFVWEDRPDAFYPDHTHSGITAHLVLEGEIAVTHSGSTRTYGKGERFDVPGKTVHSAKIGPKGCRYIIGEK